MHSKCIQIWVNGTITITITINYTITASAPKSILGPALAFMCFEPPSPSQSLHFLGQTDVQVQVASVESAGSTVYTFQQKNQAATTCLYGRVPVPWHAPAAEPTSCAPSFLWQEFPSLLRNKAKDGQDGNSKQAVASPKQSPLLPKRDT